MTDENGQTLDVIFYVGNDDEENYCIRLPQAPAIGDEVTIQVNRSSESQKFLGPYRVAQRSWDIRRFYARDDRYEGGERSTDRLASVWVQLEKDEKPA